MIKCLEKKRTYKTLFARWNETKVDTEAVEKEYSMLEEYIRVIKGAFERVTKEYEEAKSEFGDVSIEKLLAEKEGKELPVMVEGRLWEEDVLVARSYMDAPGVDGYVFINSTRDIASGTMERVRITSSNEYDLIGEFLE